MTDETDLINKDELKAAMEETAPETSGGEDYSDVELEAIEHGWNPDGVEGKRNLSAEEFMDRKPLYDKIHATEKKLRRLETNAISDRKVFYARRTSLIDRDLADLIIESVRREFRRG